jgi:hypothetical protein
MCDIIFVKNNDGTSIVGKNSDRPYLESQELVFLTMKDDESHYVKTTYIKIPKYKRRYSIILAKPFWMWGGEMGINECGLVVCNVALFSKRKFKRENSGLLGMDMIRIALETSENSEEALNKIIELVETYGQDANSSYRSVFLYDNAFLIADGTSAFYLETVDKSWAFRKVHKTESFSNTFSIENEYDEIFTDKLQINMGSKINFKKRNEDLLFSIAAGGIIRQRRTMKLLREKSSHEITAKDIAEILRDHKGFLTWSICMHYKPIVCPAETANSFIVEFKSEPIIWITGGPHPCMSIYKPFSFSNFQKYQNIFSHEAWFYKLNFNREIMKNKKNRNKFQEKIQELQNQLFHMMGKEKSADEQITIYAMRRESEIFDLTK